MTPSTRATRVCGIGDAMSDHTEALLARIDERTANILEMLDRHLTDDTQVHKEQREVFEDLEHRMRKQERFRNLLLGAAALATSGGGGLVSYLLG